MPTEHCTEMKDSGIDWIGNIPATWDVFPAGGVFSEVKAKNRNNECSNPLSFRYGTIVRKSINGGIDEDVEETLSAYTIVSPNTIMINGLNLNYDFVSQRVAIVTERGIITSAYLAVLPEASLISPLFALYLLKAYDFKMVFHGFGSGIRKTLKYSDFRQMKIIAPTMEEQLKIVHYLNGFCAEIDTAIVEAKTSIDDYTLLKQSIITKAVTKGLDSTVEMKDSGIDTIGEIPKHWQICRLRYLCDTMTGNQDTQNADESGPYPFYVRSPIIQHANVYTYEGEGILMAGDGAGAGRVFHHAFGKYAIHQRVYCFHNFRGIKSNFFYFFISQLFQFTMDKGSAQSTVPSVRLPMIQDFVFCLPPEDEQISIVEYLSSKCATIDSLISTKHSLITDLEAYKKSLIYEVVTGKRRV